MIDRRRLLRTDFAVPERFETEEFRLRMLTVNDLVKRARAAGLSATATYDQTFAGRFVTVNRDGEQVLGAFATKSAIETIAVPYVPVCA